MNPCPPLRLLLVPILLTEGLGASGCSSQKAFAEAGYSLPYNLETGIVLGAEPIRIHRGRPRACLLIHGWISSPADFGDLPAELDRLGWDVCAPLLPGHGTRPADLEGVTADQLLDKMREHYQDLRARYEEVVLIGHSLGGTVAAILAAEDPPDQLVLAVPFFAVTYRWYYVLPPRWWATLISPFVRYVGSPPRMEPFEIRSGVMGPSVYAGVPIAAVGLLFELRRRAVKEIDPSRLTMPLLVVYSTADKRSSPSAVEAFFSRVPAGSKRKKILHESGHFVFHDMEKKEAMETITGFLSAPDEDF